MEKFVSIACSATVSWRENSCALVWMNCFLPSSLYPKCSVKNLSCSSPSSLKMSGCGRKHRAKHLTRQFLDSNAWVEPKPSEQLGLCMTPPQGQHVLVKLLPTLHEMDGEEPLRQGGVCHMVLPRKFHKVIWLGVKDIVVIVDGCIELKPSPDQLKIFYKSASFALYKDAIEEARSQIETNRKELEKTPQYSNKGETTTSILPQPEAVQPDTLATREDGSDIDEDDLTMLVNPNRTGFKHQQYIYCPEEEEDNDE